MKSRILLLSILAAVCLGMVVQGRAAGLVWRGSRAEAVMAARDSGKLILLLAGNTNCGNCTYMKQTVCEAVSVREVIDVNYVCWFCPVGHSEDEEWRLYASGFGSFTLPLICVIDPGSPSEYLDRSTATQSVTVFKDRLMSHLPTRPISMALVYATTPRLRWVTETSVHYRMLKSADLVNWTFVGGLVSGTGAPIEYGDSSIANRCFYRVMGFR